MSETAITFIVTKVYDQNCPICETMARFDRSVFEGFPQILYQEISFDSLQDREGNLTKITLYRCLERYAVSPTYEIDFPTYVFLTKQGQYKGHLQGALSMRELRDRVKNIVESSSE